jgi:uncharacterized membrane protein (DUF485 family)
MNGRSLTDSILSALDLSEQLAVALRNTEGIPRGFPARFYAIALAVGAVGSGLLAWYFDYAATIAYAEPLIAGVVGSIPPGWGVPLSLAAFVLTILPTAVEMFAPRLAQGSFFVGVAFYATLLFDAATDAPRVAQTVSQFIPTAGGWDAIGYGIAYAILLLFATIGFELLFVVCAVCALFLALRG